MTLQKNYVLLTTLSSMEEDRVKELTDLYDPQYGLMLNTSEEQFKRIQKAILGTQIPQDSLTRVSFDQTSPTALQEFFKSHQSPDYAIRLIATRATTGLNEDALKEAKKAGVVAICHPTTSLPGIDIAAAKEQGIAVFNTKTNGQETAAFAFSRAVEYLYAPDYSHPLLKYKNDPWSQSDSFKHKYPMESLRVHVDASCKAATTLEQLLACVGSNKPSDAIKEGDIIVSSPNSDAEEPFFYCDEKGVYHLNVPLDTPQEAALAFSRLNIFQSNGKRTDGILNPNITLPEEATLNVGVAGYGSVGAPIVEMFNLINVKCTVSRTPEKLNVNDNTENLKFVGDVKELANSTLVVNALPDTAGKQFNRDFFDQAGDNLHLVHVGGRNTLDEEALKDTLGIKNISAQIDTHSKEGKKEHSSCLYDLDRVKMTHHNAGAGRIVVEKGNPLRAKLVKTIMQGLHQNRAANIGPEHESHGFDFEKLVSEQQQEAPGTKNFSVTEYTGISGNDIIENSRESL